MSSTFEPPPASGDRQYSLPCDICYGGERRHFKHRRQQTSAPGRHRTRLGSHSDPRHRACLLGRTAPVTSHPEGDQRRRKTIEGCRILRLPVQLDVFTPVALAAQTLCSNVAVTTAPIATRRITTSGLRLDGLRRKCASEEEGGCLRFVMHVLVNYCRALQLFDALPSRRAGTSDQGAMPLAMTTGRLSGPDGNAAF